MRHNTNLSGDTQLAYGTALRLFNESLPENILINQISIEHIERFRDSYHKDHKASSVNTRLTALKAFFTWLAERYEIPNIAKPVRKLRELPPKQRTLSREEYKLLCEKVNSYDIKVIKLLCHTGIRAAEYLSLRPESIDGQFLTVLGKGCKQRRIPLNQTCLEILQDPNIFNLLKNNHQLDRLCRRASRRAGIPEFSAHACRHFCATELVRRGVPIAKVSKILGHSSIAVTEKIYLHLSDNDLIGSTDCLEQFG